MDIQNLEEFLILAGETDLSPLPCDACGKVTPLWALVENNAHDGWVCGHCIIDHTREQPEETLEDTWESEAGYSLKAKRNQMINDLAWATHVLSTPLTTCCHALVVAYVQQLHRITLDFEKPSDVVWPIPPVFEYDATKGLPLV